MCINFYFNFFCFYDKASKNCTIGSIQLVNGSNSREGRVEACLNGIDWSAVSNVNWNDGEVRVVCSSLGFAGLGLYSILPFSMYFFVQ